MIFLSDTTIACEIFIQPWYYTRTGDLPANVKPLSGQYNTSLQNPDALGRPL
jgi:hypothetical protein